MLRVTEIFQSIQGEGLAVGRPCVFIRLAGCNLRCAYCDTPYALDHHSGEEFGIDEIIRRVRAYNTRLVQITGGEPLLQPFVYELMESLIGERFEVLLETGGHIDAQNVPEEVTRIIDVKCPSSEMVVDSYAVNLGSLRRNDQVKFVILDRRDYDFAIDHVQRYEIDRQTAGVLFSPWHGKLDPKVLAEWVLADSAPVRVHIQVHKYIWDADQRGI